MFGLFVPSSDAVAFFSSTPFFTGDEFAAHYVANGHSPSSVKRALQYYCHTGRIVRVRRGLYASCELDWDPFVLAAKLAPSPVIAYDGALAFHRLRGVEYGMSLAASRPTAPVSFNEVVYRVVPHPLPAGDEHLYTAKHPHWDVTLRVTSPARTLVDCMDRLQHGPGFVETFEAFASNPDLSIDFDEVVSYAVRLGSRIAAARVAACLWGTHAGARSPTASNSGSPSSLCTRRCTRCRRPSKSRRTFRDSDSSSRAGS